MGAMKRFISVSVSLVILTACSNQGFFADSSREPEKDADVQLFPEFNILQGRVATGAKTSLEGVRVTLKFALGEKTAITDRAGVYRIELTSEDYGKLPPYFSLILSREGFVPQSLEIAKTAQLTEDAITGERFTPSNVTLADSVTPQRSSFSILAEVRHAGDSSYSGSANSQFQIPLAEGTAITKTFNLTEADLEGALYAKLEVTGRGLEERDLVMLSAEGEESMASTETNALELTPTDGSSSVQFVNIDPATLSMGSNKLIIQSLFVKYIDDWDDFEISVVTLHIFKDKADCDGNVTIARVTENRFTAQAAQGAVCIPDHDRNARQVACMAAKTAMTDGIRAEDYGRVTEWTLRDYTQYLAVANFCFITNRLTSPAGTRPVTTNKNFADVTECKQKYNELYMWTLAQPAGAVTPLALFSRAMTLYNNDSVQALGAMSELMVWYTYAKPVGDPEMTEFTSRGAEFAYFYQRFCAETTNCTGDVDADSAQFSSQIMAYMNRQNSRVANAMIPIVDFPTDNGQYYHYYGYFTFNYILSAPVAAAFNTAGELYESGGRIADGFLGVDMPYDAEDLAVDAAGRSSAALFDCMVKDFRNNSPTTAADWWTELSCDGQMLTTGYPGGFLKNTKFLKFATVPNVSFKCASLYQTKKLLR
ncbi:MAG: hypothetical protein ABL958_03110 [Bdellovibrionia bacterium]